MKKYVLSILLAITTTCGFAWDQRPPLPPQACQVHSPYGFAQTARVVQPICREAYFVAYDAPVKIPAYVAYTLLPQNALGCFPRTNAFVADQSVQGGARPDDYAGTGYDKGHAAPDGDLSWSQQVEYESFLMTNMYPQHGSLNRGIWKLLETSIRGWAVQRNQPITIFVGAFYGAGDPAIGNGVIVPHGFYKIIINNTTGEIAGWAFPHTKPYVNLGNDLTKFRQPVANIMQQAGVKYAFPPNAKEMAPGQEWPVNYGALTNAKRAKCGKAAE
jgi:DNA/RNA endonuclease G (NUC1)